MEFFDVVKERHSVRAYTGQSIEPGKLQQILETINRAPSAGNLQAYEVYLVSDEKRKMALARAAGGQEFLAQAAAILVFCTHAVLSVERYSRRGADLYCLQDATIACTFAMLAATALGLSTVWVGAFDEDKARRTIDAPDAHRPVAMLPVGYPAESPGIRPRRSLNDLVHAEKCQESVLKTIFALPDFQIRRFPTCFSSCSAWIWQSRPAAGKFQNTF